MGHGAPAYVSFLMFWLMIMYFVWAGTESIKWLETLAAPFLVVVGLALLAWAASAAGGLGTALAGTDALAAAQPEMSSTRWLLAFFVRWLTAMVGYWATLSMAVLLVATLSTNIAANIVAPANSISALAPRRIDFRTGGMIPD